MYMYNNVCSGNEKCGGGGDGGRRGFQQHVTFTLIGAVSDLEDLNGDGTLSNYILCTPDGERSGEPRSRRGKNRIGATTI